MPSARTVVLSESRVLRQKKREARNEAKTPKGENGGGERVESKENKKFPTSFGIRYTDYMPYRVENWTENRFLQINKHLYVKLENYECNNVKLKVLLDHPNFTRSMCESWDFLLKLCKKGGGRECVRVRTVHILST